MEPSISIKDPGIKVCLLVGAVWGTQTTVAHIGMHLPIIKPTICTM